MLDFDPTREETAPPPRPAATVVVVRAPAPGGTEVEIFVVVRHNKSAFLGGALVFPGGKVDANDGTAPDGLFAGRESVDRIESLADDSTSARAFSVAAYRELLEEAGLLPTVPPIEHGEVVALQHAWAARTAEKTEAPSFSALLAEKGLRLDMGALEPWARWVTPTAEARRFDARFFLAAAPPGQRGEHDRHETTEGFWATPSDLLQRFAAGTVMLAPPTLRTIELLVRVATVEDALALAREQSLDPICPHFFMDGEVPTLALPGDPQHPVAERRVAGPTRFALVDGRFVSVEAPHPESS